jgi:hypothetical protein
MNRSSDSIVSVYSDARAEYTKQLCVFLVPAFFQFFVDLLEKSKQAMINEPKRALWQFQTYLNEIHDWNMEKVNNEIHTIFVNSGCDYLEDLLTAVFIAHTKVLTAIRLSSNKKKIEINVPKVEHFLFKVLCETSKLLWGSTYLFRDGISGIEKQQNYRNIEQLLNDGILQAIRSLVPVKSILKDFVNGDNIEGDDADSDNEDTKEDTREELLETVKEEKCDDIQKESKEINIPDQVTIQDSHVTDMNNTDTINDINTNDTNTNNEVIIPEPNQNIPQTIIIEDKPNVKFGEFDAVFDSDNPLDSDMIFDPKDGEDDEVPALEILDDVGTPLAEDVDFDNFGEDDQNDTTEISDYEELN